MRKSLRLPPLRRTIKATASGTTAARVARKRPAAAILALTPNVATSRRLSLLWGAHSVLTEDVDSYEEMTTKARHHAQDEGFAKPNDIIVVTAGIPFHSAGNTNNIRLMQI